MIGPYTVELDTIEPTDADFVAYLKENNITHIVTEKGSPAGIVVQYFGEREALVGLIRLCFTTNDELEDLEIIGLIEEADDHD